MKKKIMGALENFSKAMLQPLMYLSVGGLILAPLAAMLTWQLWVGEQTQKRGAAQQPPLTGDRSDGQC